MTPHQLKRTLLFLITGLLPALCLSAVWNFWGVSLWSQIQSKQEQMSVLNAQVQKNTHSGPQSQHTQIVELQKQNALIQSGLGAKNIFFAPDSFWTKGTEITRELFKSHQLNVNSMEESQSAHSKTLTLNLTGSSLDFNRILQVFATHYPWIQVISFEIIPSAQETQIHSLKLSWSH
jgi:hypothetical protein